jgi:hypothetical protein
MRMKETLLLEHADLTYVTTPESLAAEQEVHQTLYEGGRAIPLCRFRNL